MTDLDKLELLYRAYEAPYGIIVSTSDPVKLKQTLYAARKPHPELATLSFITSPTAPDTELWIVRKPSEAADAGTDQAEETHT